MLKLPGTAAQFLDRYWQKAPLNIPGGLERVRPAVTRNELGWLATLEDVESRLVFTERDHSDKRVRYRAETGPFDPEYLSALPKRDWTLLVHDVEKHLPVMRKLFAHVPFIPDWRIDDLMVSFAAPGGGVGPHRDNYDVFLCQGIGIREWHVATASVADDPNASEDLALTEAFVGRTHTAQAGDVLYLPPGVAHWGTATRASITYSIGMRAPQLSDLWDASVDAEDTDPFYGDPDLHVSESRAGFISPAAVDRALRLIGNSAQDRALTAESLGRYVTQTKDWLTPDGADDDEAEKLVEALRRGSALNLHGMARVAWDEHNLYVNGASMARTAGDSTWLESMCARRVLRGSPILVDDTSECLSWMLEMGAFALPEN